MNVDNIIYPAPKQEYKVLVRCLTFNHSKYIEDALNGFAIQQTYFPFVCLVMDDASTDGEQDVIKAWMERECDMDSAEYLDIPTSIVIIVPHKTNVSCTFAFYLLKQNLYGIGDKKMNHVYPWREKCEYEAMCEGDDYWIDSNKLQKQVSVMEEDPKFVMSYTAFITVDEKGTIMNRPFFSDNIKRSKSGYILPDLFKGNFIQTLTTMFRTDCLLKMDNYFQYSGPTCDYYLFMSIAALGEVAFISDYMGAYRFNPNGAIATQHDKINDSLWQIYKFFALEFVRGRIGLEYTNKIKFKLYFQFFYRSVVRFIKGDDCSFIFHLMAAFIKNAG